MMSEGLLTSAIGGILVVGAVLPYWIWMRKRDLQTLAAYEIAASAGMNEPPSLHPVIDTDRCIGSAACVSACPEQKVLGLVEGKARLIEAVSCIGHGRCFDGCPVGAISLVFGTAKRGVDIPHVSEHFETNLDGLYITGELGGMGLIRNAVRQGAQAADHIARTGGKGRDGVLDLVVVGAGPAGLSASLQALQENLNFVCLDQGAFGGAILQYPRRKLVMTQPMEIPIYGRVRAREMLKEELVDVWTEAVNQAGLEVRTGTRVGRIERDGAHYVVSTPSDVYRARQVILAIGRRGTPRRLGVPGEDLSNVAYGLLEPEQFRGLRSLVVGGGEAALEAACSLADESDTQVTLSYRGTQFTRPKMAIRDRVERCVKAGRLEVLYSSNVQRIEETSVELEQAGEVVRLRTDQVFVFAGGELPTRILEHTGVRVETKFGSR
jgi:thioredoxin reductase (NADPH)